MSFTIILLSEKQFLIRSLKALNRISISVRMSCFPLSCIKANSSLFRKQFYGQKLKDQILKFKCCMGSFSYNTGISLEINLNFRRQLHEHVGFTMSPYQVVTKEQRVKWVPKVTEFFCGTPSFVNLLQLGIPAMHFIIWIKACFKNSRQLMKYVKRMIQM